MTVNMCVCCGRFFRHWSERQHQCFTCLIEGASSDRPAKAQRAREKGLWSWESAEGTLSPPYQTVLFAPEQSSAPRWKGEQG